ncbi:E3 ubiquitin-protein ligase RNF166 isoform X2 [Pseudophryne corroboree]|uniref:E3 ubiquitin-protein ligase RNF166 isoform X2 n=1 Tax=Pseudophryne corroboree TaxID=495146 RepID=UPI003081F20E
MAMFRSLVSSSQHRQHHSHQNPAAPSSADSLETQFGCPICLEVYHKPVAIGSCGHTFCSECLQPCLQVPSPLCPLCRMPFDPKKVEKASNVDKQLSSYKAPCRGCTKKVTLAKMRSHISSCAKVQEQMANCPKFVPVVPTSQPIPRCAQFVQQCHGGIPAIRVPIFFSICSTGINSLTTHLWITALMKKPHYKQRSPCRCRRTEDLV